MDCPFYLVIGTFRIPPEADRSYSEGIEVHSDEVDICDLNAVRNAFCSQVKDCDRNYIDTILVIKNDTCGGPKIIQHWA